MTSLWFPFLILAGLMGLHCQITTVSKVTVTAGGSISVPCLYQSSYKDHVKYLCRGESWRHCKIAVKTNDPDKSGRFKISDNKTEMIFTVTFNNVVDTEDGNKHWCAVERKGPILDIKQKFELSVNKGPSNLCVDQQEITAFEGGSVTVLCNYKDMKVTEWCRLGSTCVVNRQQGSIDDASVTINDSVPDVFSVTMSGLRTDSSGWYWCGNKESQMPVHITVLQQQSTTTNAQTTGTISTPIILPTTTQFSSTLVSAKKNTSSATDGEDGRSQPIKKQSNYLMMILSTTLVLLLVFAFAAFFGWKRISRNRTPPEAPKHPGDTESDPDLFYATISHKKRVAEQQKQTHVPEASVTYSTIVKKDPLQQTTEPVDGIVIYSTVKKYK